IVLLQWAAAIGFAGPIFAEQQTSPGDAQELTRSDDAVRRGEYLARAAGCAACHTLDPARPYAGGALIRTPFGDFVPPNITPDRRTGIGEWTEENFVGAVQSGLRRDGSHLYPAMPYDSFTLMARDDVLAIRAYLMTLRPIESETP